MNRKIFITAACLVAALSVYAAGKDPVTIVWKPKAGDSYKFAQKITGKAGGGDFQLTGDMTETVKSVNADSVVVEDKTTNISISANGSDIPGPPDITETVTEKPTGEVISRESDSPGQSERAAVFSQFIYPTKPLNVGDTWQYLGKANKAKGSNDYEIDYTYKGVETQHGIAANRIDMTFKETGTSDPISGEGSVWLDPVTGEPVKLTAKIKNVDSPQGPIDVEVSQDRK